MMDFTRIRLANPIETNSVPDGDELKSLCTTDRDYRLQLSTQLGTNSNYKTVMNIWIR